MIVIVSPSKGMNLRDSFLQVTSGPQYEERAQEIRAHMKTLTRDELEKHLSISPALADRVWSYYHEEDKLRPAISLYAGQVFKELRLDTYGPKQLAYLQDKLIILSALYGLVRPFDGIKPYRLDMTYKGLDLYKLWQEPLTEELSEQMIIDLASQEYSKLIQSPNKIEMVFGELKDGQIKLVGTYAKKARGAFLHQMIKDKVTDLTSIQNIKVYDYAFSKEHSHEKKFVYLRK